MGRWRPPSPAASPYITPAGFKKLQGELDSLWLERRDVVKALSAAAAEGDRSENAEYIYRKKQLAGIDRRIRYLQKRLPGLNVVRAAPDADAVYFGARVKVEDEAASTRTYRIVGADEADSAQSSISVDSPLARALLKKRVGDEARFEADGISRSVTVVSIDYDKSETSGER